MTGQQVFSKKWLNATRRAEFDGVALDGRTDMSNSMMTSRNLSMSSPGRTRRNKKLSLDMRAVVVPRMAQYNQFSTNFFAHLNRWSSIVEVSCAELFCPQSACA
mgnify:CR=1 FL=1